MSDTPEPGHVPDMSELLAAAQQMGEQLMAAQSEAAETVVEGQAGGGVVKVALNGNYEFQSVSIDPAAVDPADVEMLEDLVLAALNDAMGKVGGAGGLDVSGLDLGGIDLGGLLGGGDLGGMLGGGQGQLGEGD